MKAVLLLRLLRLARDRVQLARDPVGYARRIGVTLGDDVWLVGLDRSTFGTEPELVTLGTGVAISSGVRFVTHDGGAYVFREEFPNLEVVGRITIEDGAMIGLGTILLPGAHVMQGSIVGAGSVVTGVIPPNSVAAGVPARVIRTREEYREAILAKALFMPPTPPSKRQQVFKDFLDGRIDNLGQPL